MATVLPKWLMRRYVKLNKKFNGNKFSFTEAQKLLNEDGRIVGMAVSQLRKNGWLTSQPNPNDLRKRIYQLKPINDIVEDL